MKSRKYPKYTTLAQWNRLAEKRLAPLLRAAARVPALRARLHSRASRPAILSVLAVGSPRMKRLNRSFRGKAYATDVLSFPAPKPIRAIGFLGELVICIPVLKRQAREQKHSPEAELDVLLVHGLLHLLGFDHERGGADARKMRALETRLLGAAGMPGAADRGLIQRSRSGK